MTILRPDEDGGSEGGHSGKQFQNPKHAQLLESVQMWRAQNPN
jgi:hypothetical protein